MSSNSATGAVAAGHGETANAAIEILSDGGNAFDAAIAAVWAACVCEPVLASPGGGGFLMALVEGRARLFDFFADTPRRKSPADAIEFAPVLADFGPATQPFHIGAGAVATPGLVPGLFCVHEHLGRLPMRRLCAPACALARQGVRMSVFQAYLFAVVETIVCHTDAARALFAPNGRLPGEGDTFRNADLADALEAIAREGPRLVTEGEIAAAITAEMKDHGGHLTATDLRDYTAHIRQPLPCVYNGYTIRLNPPPAAGGALIAAMLEHYQTLRRHDKDGAGLASMARAMAHVDTLWRRDPARIAGLGDSVRQHADVASRGTTHISIIDKDGNAAAVTVSNGEGNGHIVAGCGFMLNNMLGEEDLHPNGLNTWTPGVRLSSMMAPSLAQHRDGTLLALGSGGSNRIRTAITQVLRNLCEAQLPVAQAVDAPRLHVEAGKMDYEDLMDVDVDVDTDAGGGGGRRLMAALDAIRGENSTIAARQAWPARNMFFGGAHVVKRDRRGRFEGAGDGRRGGVFRVI